MLVCDGLKGLPDAVETVWPRTIVQTCIVHLLLNSFRYAARQDLDKLAKGLRPVYTAPTAEAAKERFLEFTETWGRKYPAIVRLWSDGWAEFVPFLAYDVEIRKVICSTNAIWVLYSYHCLGSCSPKQCMKRSVLTLNAIDGDSVVLDSKCRAGRWRGPRAPGLKRACPTQPRSADVAGAALPPYRQQGRNRSWNHATASQESTRTSAPQLDKRASSRSTPASARPCGPAGTSRPKPQPSNASTSRW